MERTDRKFWVALILYGVLGVVVWFTLGDGETLVFGRPVQLKLIPLLVLGTFVFRTAMAREAEKIRRRDVEPGEADGQNEGRP